MLLNFVLSAHLCVSFYALCSRCNRDYNVFHLYPVFETWSIMNDGIVTITLITRFSFFSLPPPHQFCSSRAVLFVSQSQPVHAFLSFLTVLYGVCHERSVLCATQNSQKL